MSKIQPFFVNLNEPIQVICTETSDTAAHSILSYPLEFQKRFKEIIYKILVFGV